MQPLRPVTVDLATGVVMLGGACVSFVRDGEDYVTPHGLRARALTFEERSHIVAGALMEREPNRALLAKLRNLASIPGNVDPELANALLLAFAGGGESGPDFAECARAACRNGNGNWQIIQKTAALVVDQLASVNESSSNVGGWTRFEFQQEPESPPSLEDCCRLMIEDLLVRGMPREVEQEQAAPAEPHSWQKQAKLLAPQDDSQPDPFDSDSDPAMLRRVCARPRAAQALRARVTLSPVEDPARQTPDLPRALSGVSSALKEIDPWPEHDPPQSAPETERVRESSAVEYGVPASATTERTAMWDDRSGAAAKLPATLRDTTAIETRVEQSARAAPKRWRAPLPANSRIQAHRLWDLPARSEPSATQPKPLEHVFPPGSPAPAADPKSSEIIKPDVRPSGLSQRDWLYEIATALFDECDLRGLDA
jgi:hypothetical protein